MQKALKDRIVSTSQGTKTGAIVACALGVSTPSPYFSGKASVTSDGFVMCNFVDSDDHMHWGAFVGSVDELDGNIAGLARHMCLTANEREQLLQAVTAWIGQDYRSSVRACVEQQGA